MFVNALTSHDTVTENGALSHSTTGSKCLDYFSKCGSYRGRDQDVVDADMASIFSEDESLALKIVLYNRLITRNVKVAGTDVKAVGQGQRDEFAKSLNWIERARPHLVDKVISKIPDIGCWKDFWHDTKNGKNYAAPESVYKLVKQVIAINDDSVHLLAKYLPKYRSKSNVKNERHKRLNNWIRGLCREMGWTELQYKKFKSDPSKIAHEFQRKMSRNDWNLDFNRLPGKALFNLMKTDVLDRHNQTERFKEWLDKQTNVKFTGFVYELYKSARKARGSVQRTVINKQFQTILDGAEVKSRILCALDTSGSMMCRVAPDSEITAMDICVSLGIYFSSLIKGAFADTVVMFDSDSETLKLKGNFCDKVDQVPANAMGSTNFQSVIDEIVRVRKQNPNIPIEEYPDTLLVVSDMRFNPTGDYYNWASEKEAQTNYEAAMAKLAKVGLPPIRIVWWHVNGSHTKDVPSKQDDKGVMMLSGFDGSILNFLLDKEEKEKVNKDEVTPYDAMIKALDQPILQ